MYVALTFHLSRLFPTFRHGFRVRCSLTASYVLLMPPTYVFCISCTYKPPPLPTLCVQTNLASTSSGVPLGSRPIDLLAAILVCGLWVVRDLVQFVYAWLMIYDVSCITDETNFRFLGGNYQSSPATAHSCESCHDGIAGGSSSGHVRLFIFQLVIPFCRNLGSYLMLHFVF